MSKTKHSVKLCRLTKSGTARAPENAPVCNMGGLALARPVGDEKITNSNSVSSVYPVPP